ncbi:MAG TPA: SpoIID/LytB domain-containing protein [Candidatus Saccharimonadales bacterium]|nr:SpoIID/LytB domain-containing protein [Candidatus Saccharimonadales bacterium]
MKSNRLKIFLILTLFCFTFFVSNKKINVSHAEPNCNDPSSVAIGDMQYCIDKLKALADQLAPAQENNKRELAGLNSQITNIKNQITGISAELDDLENKIGKREKDLAYAQKIFEGKTVDQYKFLRTYDPIVPFILSDNASSAFQEIILRQKVANEDRVSIENYAKDLESLNEDKKSLEKNKVSLAGIQKQVNDRAVFLAGEVAKVDSYIADLSSKQQELQALKAGGFSTSVGDTPDTFEPCSGPPGSSNYCDPGFRPAFAAFSFGAPHRTGMSQYGAYGRSKSGQSAETILSAYFQGSSLNKGFGEPSNITVDGYGSISLEDNYLLGIYEVPESWGDSGGYEALKAQAVAARTYALYATGNGSRSICPTESCQVYKPQLKSGKWAQAVRDTRGWVLTKDGQAAASYYASTAGGWTISQWGWSGIKDAAADWPGTAYEKIAGSPWFYKGWYKARSGATCGQSNPWLTSTQMADILNANQVLKNGGGDTSRITPVGDCWDGNPYSVSELAGIGGFTSVTSVSVVYGNDGSTQSLSFSTNKGGLTVSGSDFEKAFNLRAPGYIGLKSSLFNIEKL